MKYLIKFLLLGLIVQSCTTTIPISNSVSSRDYNGRRTIENPGFKFKINAAGVAATLATTAGMAYIGSKTDLVRKYDPESGSTKAIPVANALAGAALGFGVSTYLNYKIWNQGKSVTIKTPKDLDSWNRKFDKKAVLIENNHFLDIRLIDKVKEFDFVVKNISDVRDFKQGFPESSNKDKVIEQAYKNLNRNELIELIKLYPKSFLDTEIKIKICKNSSTFDDLLIAKNEYGDIGFNYENKFAELVSSFEQLSRYEKFYSKNSKYWKTASLNSFKSEYKQEEIVKLMQMDKGILKYDESDFKGITDKYILRNYFVFILQSSNKNELNQLKKLIEKYKWIDYSYKKIDLFREVWKICDKQFEDGDLVIVNLKKLLISNRDNKNYFTESELRPYIFEKLQAIIKKDLKISKMSLKSTVDISDWDEWEKIPGNAFVATEMGELIYVFSGEIQNQSKYNLPVKAVFSAYSYLEFDEKIPFLDISLVDVANFLTALTGKGEGMSKKIAQFSPLNKEFYIPNLKAKEKMNFVVIFDFGNMPSKFGLDLGIIKATYKHKIDSIPVVLEFLNDNISQQQINQQIKEIELVYDKLNKKASMFDFLSDYDPEKYRWKPIKKRPLNECGCKIKKIQDEGWIIKNGFDTMTFENGYSVDIKYEYGKWQIVNILLNDKFDSYEEMKQKIIKDCINKYCE